MNAKDLVLIEGLEIRTVIGIYDWEREIRQTVRLDLEMAWEYLSRGQERPYCRHAGLQSRIETADLVCRGVQLRSD